MLGAIRRWFREESLGITIPVGVVLGLTAEMVISQLVLGLEAGYLQDHPDASPLEISPIGIHLLYQGVLAYAVALIVLAIVAYVLFFLPMASAHEEEEKTRECPECKSDIAAGATRCAFCTSAVPPLETPA